jgi:hypothetical protein
MSTVPQQMFQALKQAKWCFDEELHGREVNDAQWEECYAACSAAIEAYPGDTVASKAEKGTHARGRRVASG